MVAGRRMAWAGPLVELVLSAASSSGNVVEWTAPAGVVGCTVGPMHVGLVAAEGEQFGAAAAERDEPAAHEFEVSLAKEVGEPGTGGD